MKRLELVDGAHVGGHVRAEVTDPEQVVAAFVGFLEADPGWAAGVAWSPVEG